MPETQPFTPKFSPRKVAQLFTRIHRYTHDEALSDVAITRGVPLSDDITDEVMAVVAMYGEHLQVSEDRKARCVQMILAILIDDTDRLERMRLSKAMISSRVQNTAEVVSMQLNRMSRDK
ncbi:TPA: hypothetical protein DIV49_01700 [Candidatus Saccharibacteria bacterium]|nr:hypothetical protein [Candidatus Saccharibacteria bacterium]HRJ91054.1 hypothetical protein [Candidatus Saccharibacteria bacterium]